MSDVETGDAGRAGVQPGEVLAGKYRVERVLGEGGMGVVVAAHHLQLDEKVALKFLLPDALRNEQALARFEREARAAVKIKSEHVARVIDVGRLENGAPYMVMEYLEGGDLHGMLETTKKLPPPQAVDFVLQASEALAEAHSLGIVHRDLKPANLFCTRRRDGQPCIKVLDFGISKMTLASETSGEDMAMTKTTAVMGSPKYMSPEQMVSSKGVDSRTDIWSLGVILYELLSGDVPFKASTLTELAVRVSTYPLSPMWAPADVPPGLQQVVTRCLEKDRDRRYQTVAELADALAPYAPPRSLASVERIHGFLGTTPAPVDHLGPTVAFPVSPAAKPSCTEASWQSGPGPSEGRRKTVVIAGVAAAALIAVVGAVGLVMQRKPASAAATAAPPATEAATTTSSAVAPPPAPSTPPAATLDGPAATATAAPSATAQASSTPRSNAPPGTRPKPKAAPSRRDCNPPYYFDSTGRQIFRKECL